MIKAKLLNSDATLNAFFPLSSLEFVPGTTIKVVLRLLDSQRDLRRVLEDPAATVKFQFVTDPSIADLELVATPVDALDRSLWTATLTPAQSATLVSSNIGVEVDLTGAGTLICKAVLTNAMSKIVLGDC